MYSIFVVKGCYPRTDGEDFERTIAAYAEKSMALTHKDLAAKHVQLFLYENESFDFVDLSNVFDPQAEAYEGTTPTYYLEEIEVNFELPRGED